MRGDLFALFCHVSRDADVEIRVALSFVFLALAFTFAFLAVVGLGDWDLFDLGEVRDADFVEQV